jgi:hypothetical protein
MSSDLSSTVIRQLSRRGAHDPTLREVLLSDVVHPVIEDEQPGAE